VLVGPVEDSDPDPTPVYELTDETTGTNYRLMSGFVDLQDFVGQRVAIAGTRAPGPSAPDAPLVLDVTRVAPAGGRTASPAATATAPAGGDTLPATGGAPAAAIATGAALAAGGLLARRIVR
jgi:hypothetical protein